MLLQTFLFLRLCTAQPLWQLSTHSIMCLENCGPDFDLNHPVRSNGFGFGLVFFQGQRKTRLETHQHRLQSASNKASCPCYGCLRSQFAVWHPSSQRAKSIFSLWQQTTKSIISFKVGQRPLCKFSYPIKTMYKHMQKALKSLLPRLNFQGTPNFYQQLSLALSEAYSSSNCQHKRFLI